MPTDPQGTAAFERPDHSPDLLEELLVAERHTALVDALLELPTQRRDLLLLLIEDPPLTYAEISDRSGIPVGSIGPTRARALQQLRRTRAFRRLTSPDPDGSIDERRPPRGPGRPRRAAAALAARRDVQSRHREAARAAFTWRTVDAELMELTYDSLDEPDTVRGVAVGTQPRALSFTSRVAAASRWRSTATACAGTCCPRGGRHRGDDATPPASGRRPPATRTGCSC